jgi:NAD+ kinase
MKRVFVVANLDKPRVRPALDELRPWLEKSAELVGIEEDGRHDLTKANADLILILGGDGTLLSVARRLEGQQVPLMGVNFGRLGFLSSFTPQNFRRYLERYLAQGLPVRHRQMLEVNLLPPGMPYDRNQHDECCKTSRFTATALNDAVITAGPPFHMIELEISADSEGGIRYFGDGVIVSTSSGSTAYNVSAGGPIISADVEALCITPICPHSLSFRPVVVSSQTTVRILASKVNEGTTLFCDGQAMAKLGKGDVVVVRRGKFDALLVEDPDAREWRSLAEKLNWAASPRYNEHE